MDEIVPGVLNWAWFSERHGYNFNGFFVPLLEGNIVIDPVTPPEEVMEELRQNGVDRVLLTNRNHTRASAAIREATGAAVAMHRADAEYARAQGAILDDELRAGDRIGPLVVVPAPGKSPGEVVLHWPDRRILFVGDACVGKPPGACALLPEAVMDDPPALRATLRKIAEELDFDTLLMGDGACITTGGREALRALVRSFA